MFVIRSYVLITLATRLAFPGAAFCINLSFNNRMITYCIAFSCKYVQLYVLIVAVVYRYNRYDDLLAFLASGY